VLLLLGCVQPAMAPNINSATARVLDAAGIQTLVAEDAGCCGAIHLHGGDPEGGLAHMRRNIDAWWPLVSTGGVEAIVMNASGCGVTVKEYGHSLRHDPAYADKASRIADLTRDLCELLPDITPTLAKRLSAKRSGLGSPSTRRAACSTGSSCAAASRRTCARSASASRWR
jgi:glycolate oxidase iron-sulfur subunit